MISKRYQLGKDALRVVDQRHPWIYRSHLSSAADTFKNGQWLHLVDHQNKTVAYGVYEKTGLIAVRVFKFGATAPDTRWFREMVTKALARRKPLLKYTNGFRALHGENDGLPGVVIDVYERSAVLQTYATSVDGLGRYLAQVVAQVLGLSTIVWKIPSKRRSPKPVAPLRILRGHPPGNVTVREGKIALIVPITEGQKYGTWIFRRARWILPVPTIPCTPNDKNGSRPIFLPGSNSSRKKRNSTSLSWIPRRWRRKPRRSPSRCAPTARSTPWRWST